MPLSQVLGTVGGLCNLAAVCLIWLPRSRSRFEPQSTIYYALY
jgi:hypothetical protein